MKTRAVLAAVSALLLVMPALAPAHDDDDDGKGKLGKVSFENSCDPKVQPMLQRGVAMLHSFWYSAAEKTFRDVLAHDPGCAIATWGFASIMMSNPLAGQGASAKGAEQSIAMLEQGRKIGAKTQRERDYIEAVAAYYEDWSNRSERMRQVARAKAYEALAARYPKDDEAQIFSALYIAGTQLQSDQTYAAYLKAAAILEKQFVKYPDHPGVAHYLIHSYDAPPIAQQGLNAARRYAGIAPDAPHALHMPSHIFTRVGAWEESVATNLRSAEAARKGGEPNEAYHASDYAVYAYLQLGRDRDAKRMMEEVLKVTDYNPAQRTAPYAMAAMQARYAMERGAWKEAMNLQVKPSKMPNVDAMTYSARAIGASRSGDVAAAQKDAEELARLHKALQEAKDNYWATEVEVMRLTAAGWIAFAQGNADNALKFMRAAADLEDKNEKSIVTPGRVIPARELLGDMLLELKQPAAALTEYEASQLREPNRFRGFYGSALAAEAAGDRPKAADYYGKLLALAKNSDGNRPELARAKSYVAQR
jgi:tetratricopeptide (TPR) repeat protein